MKSLIMSSAVAGVVLGAAIAVGMSRIPARAPVAGVGPVGRAAAAAANVIPQAVPTFAGPQPPNKVVFGINTNSIEWEPTPWANEPFAGTRWMPKGGLLDTSWKQFAYLAVNEEYLP